MKLLPSSLKEVQKLIQYYNGNKLLDKLKLFAMHVYLIESENSTVNLNLALYFIPFKHLSNSNEELIFLANLIAQRAFICEYSVN